MNINSSPYSSEHIVDYNEGEIENGDMAVEFIMRAAQEVKEEMADGKQDIEFSLSQPAENEVSKYNIRINENVYSLGVGKWSGNFKLMQHDLEHTSTLVEQGGVEIIEQDVTFEMENYLNEEGFDVEVDEGIEGPDAEEAKEFIEEKFGMEAPE
jgi:hypothetical protein